ncbi:MAG TPA: ABC transporter ATP-binding protein, partial [Cyanobium sp.]|nr:ABC transporter ATP-binding protein [Cyanobium sp.]
MPNSSPPDPLPGPDALVLQVEALQVRYGERPAVRGIDFGVAAGEIFGLIGADGAGKTSTFHVLAGVMQASGGVVRVLGRPPRQARERIGYLTQQFSLYPDLSVAENLRYVAELRRVPRTAFLERRERLLRLMDLHRFGQRLAGRLSGGMKQKLALCCALIDTPELLLLDEPTTGVDPVSRREFWDVLASLAASGVTIVVATPYLDEAERCHRIAMLQEGRIQRIGTPAELKQGLGLARLELRCPRLAEAERALMQAIAGEAASRSSIVDVQTFGDRLDVLVDDPSAGTAAVREIFQRQGLVLEHLELTTPTLENVFVTRLRQEGSQPPLLPFPGAGLRQAREGAAIAAH